MITHSQLSPLPLNNRRKDIDGVKALAIVAVILYHMGFATYGYLGVDVFFVVSGYLLMKSLLRRNGDSFRFVRELCQRLFRLYPLILIATAVCLVAGFFTMLPDDYDNLAQSVIATNFSANNILAYITTGDYWQVVNELKPLMHTWYLGVLVQFYVVFLLIYKLVNKAVKPEKRIPALKLLVLIATALSLTAYCLPMFNANMKFYTLPFRFFELSIGCLAGLIHISSKGSKISKQFWVALPVLVVLLFVRIGGGEVFDKLRLLLTVVSALCLMLYSSPNRAYSLITSNAVVTSIGKASFSIYIWHQIMLAFARYTITAKFTAISAIIYLTAVAAISAISYALLERKLGAYVKNHYKTSIVAIVILTTLISGAAGCVYLRAGVVRDVPELGITTTNIKRGMHSQYNHRIWNYENVGYDNNGKLNLLIVGNSFARDWANIVLESDYGANVNISYAFSWDESMIPLIQDASYIFTQRELREEIPHYVWENVANADIVWGIGTKQFGENNGIIYARRNNPDYYSISVSVPDDILTTNIRHSQSWGENYVDMIGAIANPDGTVPVFTPDGMFISQDCTHLTEAGAKHYARILDLSPIFSNAD